MTLSSRSALALTALAALGLAAARPAHAGGLDGTSVTGSLMFGGGSTNYFDPAYGFVPAGYENTAGITVPVSETQTEFGFQDGANLDTANFTNSTLTLTDVSNQGGTNAQYTFTDTAFTSVSKVSDTFSGGLSYSLVGDTLTIDAPAFSSAGTYTAVFNIGTSAPVPEASTTASLGLMLALGMAGLAVAKRKKGAAQA